MNKIFAKILLNSPLVRSSIVISIGRIVTKFRKSDFVEIEGRKMFVHGNDGLALSIFKVYEPLQTAIVKEHIKKGDTVVDVGAHVGYYTLLFSQLVGPNGKVFAFEPDPSNFALLKKSIDINGYQNIVLIQKAVSDINGKIRLYLGDTNRAINRIYDADMGDTNEYIEVDTVSLDDYFSNYEKPINFVKIDAEGSEYGVIQGMSAILQKMKDLKIMTEFDPYLMSKFGADPRKFIQKITDHNFKIYDVFQKTNNMKPLEQSELLSRIPVEEGNYTYLFCVKK